MDGNFQRSLARGHARGRCDRAQRIKLVRPVRKLHERKRVHRLKLHVSRCLLYLLFFKQKTAYDIYAAMEDQPAAVSKERKERAVERIQMRLICGRTALRTFAQKVGAGFSRRL